MRVEHRHRRRNSLFLRGEAAAERLCSAGTASQRPATAAAPPAAPGAALALSLTASTTTPLRRNFPAPST